MILATLLLSLPTPGPTAANDNLVVELLRSHPEGLAPYLEDPARWRLQILVGQVIEDDTGVPRLERHAFRLDAEYTYPASSIKTFAALAALQRVQEDPRLELSTPLRYDALFDDEVVEDSDETNLEGGAITVGHEVRKLSLVSDNRAYNRLYELVGQRELHELCWSSGFSSLRLHHRLSEFRSREDNRLSPRVDLGLEPGAPYAPERASGLVLDNRGFPGLDVGRAHVAGGELVERPMSFRHKNQCSLRDLQDLVVRVARPDVLLEEPPFPLDDELRLFLLEAMTQVPSESRNPRYDPERYPDDYVKFLAPGLGRVVPLERLQITNKVGRAYGFSTENAYVHDRESGRGFFVAATLYTNDNGVLNDGVYEYEERADPFFADLGEALARRFLID